MIDRAVAEQLAGLGALHVLEPLLTASALGVIDLQAALARYADARRDAETIVFLKTAATDSRSEFRHSVVPAVGSAILWIDDRTLGGCFVLAKGARLVLEHDRGALVGGGEPWLLLDGPMGRPLDSLIESPILNGRNYVVDSYVAGLASARWIFDVPRIAI